MSKNNDSNSNSNFNCNSASYKTEELDEFKEIIQNKLQLAHNELKTIVESLDGKSSNTAYNTAKLFEDDTDVIEKERLSQLAERQRKFIKQLENALVRINNRTYGICSQTGELIDKARLKLVPHTLYSLAPKITNKP